MLSNCILVPYRTEIQFSEDMIVGLNMHGYICARYTTGKVKKVTCSASMAAIRPINLIVLALVSYKWTHMKFMYKVRMQ